MSYLDSERLAAEWLAGQSERTIDFEWEIQHHNQMHAAYVKQCASDGTLR